MTSATSTASSTRPSPSPTAVAYGWPKSVAHDPEESNRRLLELNRAIAAGEVEYDPFRER